MKSSNEIIACIIFALCGIFIAKIGSEEHRKLYGTPVMASTIPSYNLPLDFQLSQVKSNTPTDTIRDTVYVDTLVTKKSKVSAKRKTKKNTHVLRDTVYVPLYFILMPWVREEKAQDSTYCVSDTLSENVNHSVRDSLNSDSTSHVLVRSH